MINSLHEHEFMTAIKELPQVLMAVYNFVNECKGSQEIMEFSKDLGQCVTNAETILDNKIAFLDHI